MSEGQVVHVDTDNEQWGRVVGIGVIVEVHKDSYLIQMQSTHQRQLINVPYEDVDARVEVSR